MGRVLGYRIPSARPQTPSLKKKGKKNRGKPKRSKGKKGEEEEDGVREESRGLHRMASVVVLSMRGESSSTL